MTLPIELSSSVPPGASVEVVDGDDPCLLSTPLVFKGSREETEGYWRKVQSYRLWEYLTENVPVLRPNTLPSAEREDIAQKIQEFYCSIAELDFDYSSGIDSVTLIFPASLKPRVRDALSHLPPRLPYVAGSFIEGAKRSIHVHGKTGVKSLAVQEKCLEIGVPDPCIYLYMNNPSMLQWVVYVPRGQRAVEIHSQPLESDKPSVTERADWDKVVSWLRSRGLSANGHQYPEGANGYPDYRAWIEGIEYDVEMTRFPGLKKWTVTSSDRRLDEKIRRISQQPSETRDEVVDAASRMIGKKSERARRQGMDGAKRRSMLVLSNWSSLRMVDDPCWDDEDTSAFYAVMLIEFGEVHCVKGSKDLVRASVADGRSFGS